jgi:hypothetical protein
MTIHEIIREYLEENHFDGLVNPDLECACAIDDLCPCESTGDCEPGHKEPCDYNERIAQGLEPECDGPCDWHMVHGPRKDPK